MEVSCYNNIDKQNYITVESLSVLLSANNKNNNKKN